jgi:hypothetical protein
MLAEITQWKARASWLREFLESRKLAAQTGIEEALGRESIARCLGERDAYENVLDALDEAEKHAR